MPGAAQTNLTGIIHLLQVGLSDLIRCIEKGFSSINERSLHFVLKIQNTNRQQESSTILIAPKRPAGDDFCD